MNSIINRTKDDVVKTWFLIVSGIFIEKLNDQKNIKYYNVKVIVDIWNI